MAALLVVVFLAGVLLAVLFDAEPLEAVVLEAVVRAAVFFAVGDDVVPAEAFFAAACFAGAFLAAALEAVVLLGVDFEAVDFDGVALEALDFEAVDRAADDEVLVFFAGEVRLVVDLVVLAFFVVEAGAFFAEVVELVADAFVAVPVAARVVEAAAASVSFGSFFAPDTTALRSAPALNFGMAVFLALMRSPVRGLRTQRASRTRFSKEPKPVMATFSPLATSRVIVSITDSSAWAACFLLPS